MPWFVYILIGFQVWQGADFTGTYYVLEVPLSVTVLNVPLNNHEDAMANRIAGTYEVKFIKACFGALQTRTQFNVDTFFTNNNIDFERE